MNMKNISFVDISDGSTLDHIQMLVTEEQVQSLSYGTCVAIDGKMIDSSGSKQSLIHYSQNSIASSFSEKLLT